MEEQQTATQAPLTQQEKEQIFRQKAVKIREMQTLKLSCARVRQQMERSQNPRYNELLERELNHLESQLARMQ